MEDQVTKSINENRKELWNLSFRDLFYKYVRFLPLFVLSVALSLLVAFLYLRYTIPIYNVGGTMNIKTEQQGGRSDLIEDVLANNKAQNILSEIEVLKSSPLMQRVVDSLKLQFSYFIKGKIKKNVNIYRQGPFIVEALQITDSSRSFSMKIKFLNDNQFRINDEVTASFGQGFKNSNGVFRLVRTGGNISSNDYSVLWQPTAIAAGAYAGGIYVVPKTPGTGILSIGMRTPNPLLGADIINRLMVEYGSYSIEEKKQSSGQILDFIDGRLADYGERLDSLKQDLLDYQLRNNLIDQEAQSAKGWAVLSETDKAINEQTERLNISSIVDEYLKDKRNEFSKVPSTLSIDDITFTQLVAEYNKAQIDRQLLLNSNVPVNNPVVKEIEGQIEKLRTSILENIRNIKSSMNGSIGRLRSLSSQNQVQLRAMPAKVKELAEKKAQVESSQGMYKILQEKREETAISQASTIASSNIINQAYPSTTPIKPNKRAIQILAILLGISLPAIFIFAGEVLNDKVTTRFDIEKITQVPILGEIGHSYSENTLVVSKSTRSMVAEQFRIIRSNLQYVLNKKEKPCILVTSSFSGEGKSYVSTNMGAVLGLAGKKTIVLEFDIRKPKVLSGLGISKGPGITNFLVGKGELANMIKPVPEHENLFVLGCGPVPPNPSELLLDSRLDELFAWLKDNFDVVIIDTAPVGMVSDAMTLGKYADCTLYLVRQGHTFKKQVALIDEFYQDQKLPKVSIIINDVKLKPGYGYYGYGRYGYGYGYGYGSYYEEETAPQNFSEKILNWLDIRRFFNRKRKK
ncbi:MAG: polysaccharide biosynthesis tyrosine autokinase [Chitinophagaceae bacterium]|nr:polysaccharide biosynthesis tyrosine autokinase [Chitinophagaceae bacterium]